MLHLLDASGEEVAMAGSGGAGVRIRTYLDIGVVPTESADATIFADWGGHDIVPPVQDAQGNWKGLDYRVAWTTHMASARREIFRHSSSPAFGGGSNSENNIAFSAGINEPSVLAHESGRPVPARGKPWRDGIQPHQLSGKGLVTS